MEKFKINKVRITKFLFSVFTMVSLLLTTFGVKTFAAGEPTMDSNWGFSKGNSLQVTSRYCNMEMLIGHQLYHMQKVILVVHQLMYQLMLVILILIMIVK